LKVYQVNIRPLTGFGIPIKGDTLFGHLCWQLYYDSNLVGKSLESLLTDYSVNPFCIISSAFPFVNGKVYLKKPSLPMHILYKKYSDEELISKRKDLKKEMYFKLELPLSPLHELEFVDKPEGKEVEKRDEQVRCTIHRLLGTTSGGGFSPYVIPKHWYITDLAIFVGIRDDIKVKGIIEGLSRIGKFGYGKDATSGWGKFEIVSYQEIDFYERLNSNCNAYYTLSPSLPEKNINYRKIYYEPTIRFGRHGDILSVSKNPFKAPVLMADEGAVYIPEKFEKRFYLGRAVYGVSSILEKAVVQAYSLVIPLEVHYA